MIVLAGDVPVKVLVVLGWIVIEQGAADMVDVSCVVGPVYVEVFVTSVMWSKEEQNEEAFSATKTT